MTDRTPDALRELFRQTIRDSIIAISDIELSEICDDFEQRLRAAAGTPERDCQECRINRQQGCTRTSRIACSLWDAQYGHLRPLRGDDARAAAGTPEGEPAIPEPSAIRRGNDPRTYDKRRKSVGYPVKAEAPPTPATERLIKRVQAYAETRGRVEDADGFLFEDVIAALSLPPAHAGGSPMTPPTPLQALRQQVEALGRWLSAEAETEEQTTPETPADAPPVPKDHPLMQAWERYEQTDAYENTFRWAAHEQHRDGSLWAAFEQGWRAATSATPMDTPPTPEMNVPFSVVAPNEWHHEQCQWRASDRARLRSVCGCPDGWPKAPPTPEPDATPNTVSGSGNFDVRSCGCYVLNGTVTRPCGRHRPEPDATFRTGSNNLTVDELREFRASRKPEPDATPDDGTALAVELEQAANDAHRHATSMAHARPGDGRLSMFDDVTDWVLLFKRAAAALRPSPTTGPTVQQVVAPEEFVKVDPIGYQHIDAEDVRNWLDDHDYDSAGCRRIPPMADDTPLTDEALAKKLAAIAFRAVDFFMPSKPEHVWRDVALVEEAARRLRARGTWQPIATAPKDGTAILVWVEADAEHEIGWWERSPVEGSQRWMCMEKDRIQPTHWMPLPDAPQEPPDAE